MLPPASGHQREVFLLTQGGDGQGPSCRYPLPKAVIQARSDLGSSLKLDQEKALSLRMAPESDQLRLLLVDDESKLTEFLKLELELEGYGVEVAADGASGLIALRREPGPDLVLLDWNLPDFTGLDICRRIRATGMTVPVLMLTGYDEVKDKVEALDAKLTTTSSNPFH